jgi:hypothetical protein
LGPTVTTSSVTGITSNAATSGGYISSSNYQTITARGVCWSTSPNPTIDLTTKTNQGMGLGGYESPITGLTPLTTYYVRAYATHSIGTTYGPELSFTTTLAVGDTYQGGKVAYIFQTGDAGYIAGQIHGLIAAPSDQNTGVYWGGSFSTSMNTGTAFGTGSSNTDIIVIYTGTGTYAAQICSSLVLNSFSDWYLPSQDELNKLYLNRVAIGGFSVANYWSSSERNSNTSIIVGTTSYGEAYCQTFDINGIQYNKPKSNTYYVRAVRSF